MNSKPDTFLDSDHVIREVWPEADAWNDFVKIKNAYGPTVQLIGMYLDEIMSNQKDKVLLTNIWHRDYLRRLGRIVASEKWPVGFFRQSPEEMSKLSEGRDSPPIPVKTARSWISDMEKYHEQIFSRFIWLQEGEFLSDYIGEILLADGQIIVVDVKKVG